MGMVAGCYARFREASLGKMRELRFEAVEIPEFVAIDLQEHPLRIV
jgi:hypothetical protein